MEFLANGLLRKRNAIACVIVVLVATGSLLMMAGDIRQDDDILKFLPEGNRDVALFTEINKRFGSLDVAIVGIEEADYKQENLDALLRFARHEKVMIKIGPLQGLCGRKSPYLDVLPLIEQVVGAYGADRCMWESDSGGPISMEDPMVDYPACIALIRDHATFLSQEEKDALLFRTAADFFFDR